MYLREMDLSSSSDRSGFGIDEKPKVCYYLNKVGEGCFFFATNYSIGVINTVKLKKEGKNKEEEKNGINA